MPRSETRTPWPRGVGASGGHSRQSRARVSRLYHPFVASRLSDPIRGRPDEEVDMGWYEYAGPYWRYCTKYGCTPWNHA